MTFPTFVNFFVQKRFLFVFKHFWRNHEQNNMPQINLYLFRNHYRQCFNDMCKTHPCMQCTIYIYLKVLQFLGMVQISFALNIPSGEFALHPFCRLQFLVLYQNNLLIMQLQILNNQRYLADVVETYLLFEVWQKNNIVFDLWLYLFPLIIPVRNDLMDHRHELYLLRGP